MGVGCEGLGRNGVTVIPEVNPPLSRCLVSEGGRPRFWDMGGKQAGEIGAEDLKTTVCVGHGALTA